MRWLLLLVAFTGCVLFPHEVDTTTPRSVHVVDEVAGPPDTLALHVTTSYSTLHIDATHPVYCYRETRQYVEHRPRTVPGLLAGRLIAGAAALANALSTESYLEDRTLKTTRRDCSVAARAAVLEVVLPSGAVVHAVTDARGLVHVKIPASEPARGVAIVRAGDTEARLAYSPENW